MRHLGFDFGKGREYKCALVHGWMRQREFGAGEDEVVVEQQVEVDNARTFGWSGGAVAAHGVLDGEKSVKEIKRSKRCFEQSCGVYELRLVEIADRSCGVKAGDSFNPAKRGHSAESFVKIVCGWAER